MHHRLFRWVRTLVGLCHPVGSRDCLGARQPHGSQPRSPTGGQVANLWVTDGDSVQMGAPLLRLNDHAQNVQLDLTEGQLFEIMARRARLEAERDDRLFIEFDRVLQTKAAENPDVGHMLHGQVQLFETPIAVRQKKTAEPDRADHLAN